MRRAAFLFFLLTTTGCGSCLDDKRVPESEAPGVQTVTTVTDGGKKRRIQVGEGNDFASALERLDGGGSGSGR